MVECIEEGINTGCTFELGDMSEEMLEFFLLGFELWGRESCGDLVVEVFELGLNIKGMLLQFVTDEVFAFL